MNNWIQVQDELPPRGLIVDVKIDDELGCRNETKLKLGRDPSRLWWTPDGEMYIYYTPTHWKYCEEN